MKASGSASWLPMPLSSGHRLLRLPQMTMLVDGEDRQAGVDVVADALVERRRDADTIDRQPVGLPNARHMVGLQPRECRKDLRRRSIGVRNERGASPGFEPP